MRSGSVPREAEVWARALPPEESVSHIINHTAGFRHKAKGDVMNFRQFFPANTTRGIHTCVSMQYILSS